MRREIRALTSLRFLAAAAVLLAHTLWPLASLGLAPMTVFFCLSGFVLTRSYGDEVQPGRFFLARFARIYPLYALLLLLDGLQTGYDRQTLADLALVQAWQAPARMEAHLGVAWSLSVEAFFYASFPLLSAGLGRLRERSLVGLAVALPLLCAGLALSGAGESALRFFPPVRFADFAFGCVLARLSVRLPARLGILLAVALVAVMALPVASPLAYDAAYLPLAGLLILWLAQHRVALLERPRLVYLGAASYALYLCHLPLRDAAYALYGHGEVVTLVVIAVALACSLVLYTWIEAPARRVIRAWRGRVIATEAPA